MATEKDPAAGELLTPEDVRNSQIPTVRFREGYDMDEVDQLLDKIAATLDSHVAELKKAKSGVSFAATASAAPNGVEMIELSKFNELRAEALKLQRDLDEAHDDMNDLQLALASASSEDLTEKQFNAELPPIELSLPDQTPEPLPAPPAPSVAEAPSAAAQRLLEMATRTHDEMLAEAQEAADRIRGEAEKRANVLLSSAQETADREAAEIAAAREEALGDLDAQRTQAEEALSRLRELEESSRSELLKHFTAKLEALSEEPKLVRDAEELAPAPRLGRRAARAVAVAEPQEELPVEQPVPELIDQPASADEPKSEEPGAPAESLEKEPENGETPALEPEEAVELHEEGAEEAEGFGGFEAMPLEEINSEDQEEVKEELEADEEVQEAVREEADDALPAPMIPSSRPRARGVIDPSDAPAFKPGMH